MDDKGANCRLKHGLNVQFNNLNAFASQILSNVENRMINCLNK